MIERLTGDEFLEKITEARRWAIGIADDSPEITLIIQNSPEKTEIFLGPDQRSLSLGNYLTFLDNVGECKIYFEHDDKLAEEVAAGRHDEARETNG